MLNRFPATHGAGWKPCGAIRSTTSSQPGTATPGENDYRYADEDERYRYRERQAPAWGYWDDDEDAGYRGRADSATGGAEGNERLTGLTGMVLLVLFAAEGFTVLAVRQMLTLHFFLGMLLIGPVLLKLSSTIYRFARYYCGDAEYRRKGPPACRCGCSGRSSSSPRSR